MNQEVKSSRKNQVPRLLLHLLWTTNRWHVLPVTPPFSRKTAVSKRKTLLFVRREGSSFWSRRHFPFAWIQFPLLTSIQWSSSIWMVKKKKAGPLLFKRVDTPVVLSKYTFRFIHKTSKTFSYSGDVCFPKTLLSAWKKEAKKKKTSFRVCITGFKHHFYSFRLLWRQDCSLIFRFA